jgi:hypothetical protein
MMTSTQLCEAELSPYQSPDGIPLFSDKLIDRLEAMAAITDCSLVSSDGVVYPVHKAALLQQSKVLRRAHTAG